MDAHQKGLVGLFSTGSFRPHQALQYLPSDLAIRGLIIDPNHRWSSHIMSYGHRIIRPNSRKEFMDLVRQISDYIYPRLSFIYVDDLPLYFRDYYGKGRLYTQNMRGYGYCLAILSQIAANVLVLYGTYANALNPSEPIYFNHSTYYSQAIYKLSGDPGTMVLHQII